jgi:Skp family chaperone for outer membrane proteins
MEETVNTLIDLDTLEVSLVDRGANQRVFAIRKAEQMNDIIKDIIDVPLEQETEVVEALVSKELTDDARHGLIGAMRIVQAYKDEAGMREALVALATLLDFEKPEEEETPMAQEDVEMEKSSEDSINMNDIPDEVRAQVENLWKANEEAVKKAAELEEVLKAERDERLTKEFVAKAAESYGNIPGHTADELGLMVKSLHTHDAEAAQKIEGLLKTVSQVISKSELFVEAGVTVQDEGVKDPLNQLDALAQKHRSENPGVSYAKAYDVVMKSDEGRKLYTEYVQSN